MTAENQRRAHVRWVLNVTKDTPLEPSAYERSLLLDYVRGTRSLDEIIELLEVYQAGVL